MRFSAILAAATLAAGANALNCTQRISNGILGVWKTGIEYGTESRLTMDATGQVITTTGGQNGASLTACDGNTIIFPGSREIVVTKGRIEVSGGCLGRNTTTGAITTQACITAEPAANNQLWQFSLVYQTDGEHTGSNVELIPYNKGTFTHIAGGKLYRKSIISRPVNGHSDSFHSSSRQLCATEQVVLHLQLHRVILVVELSTDSGSRTPLSFVYHHLSNL